MSKRITRLAAVVADLRAKKLAAAAVPLTVAELQAAGFRVYPWANGAGLAVDEAPGLDAKLDELEGKGIRPGLVFILRKLEDEPGERVTDPPTNRRRNDV